MSYLIVEKGVVVCQSESPINHINAVEVDDAPDDCVGMSYDGSMFSGITDTEKAQAELTDSELKMKGAEFEGVMCSATANDQFGLTGVKEYVRQGNDINFHFENGNSLVLTATNIDLFEATWFQFRNSFFPLP